jgi:hypothetical protein
MFRLASLFGLAVLVVAALAVTTTPRASAEELQPTNDGPGDEPQNRSPAKAPVAVLSFHAPFSLN